MQNLKMVEGNNYVWFVQHENGQIALIAHTYPLTPYVCLFDVNSYYAMGTQNAIQIERAKDLIEMLHAFINAAEKKDVELRAIRDAKK